ncbi:class I SAM-dependent methyltransferase [Draconibacterium halophilum]|uniref:Class I SAM-dependent methyltransferase n=1 Tax=Draconibacterium halophilum TaxID=2706887 RepID=A0A6C0RD41_9BACT|nr:class I SAM-dependent methyltransferase [Draconibacterium halophilum]QIA07906.1 class I SAM-dependent methyltransferase [Draconibacterium halophilum]
MNNFWNDRYSATEYAYGEAPNDFLKKELPKLAPGKVLFPAEGEGRNAVYAAKLGWEVTAFDPSIEGKRKALLLANKHNISINYEVIDYQNANFKESYFDCICLTYAHMPGNMRNNVHQKLASFLKPGGTLILEGFSKEQINRNTGGPKDISFLFDEKELKNDFSSFRMINTQKSEIRLNEGLYHRGLASIIRLTGIK